MNPSRIKSPFHLALPLLLSSLTLHAQFIENPSFEIDTFSVAPGTIAANSPITGWSGSPADRVGINPAGGSSTYADNGAIPNGSKVAFLTSSTDGIPSTLSTTLVGLTPGVTYKVDFRANASYGSAINLPGLAISVDADTPSGASQVAMLVSRVASSLGGSEPYHRVAFEFIATASSHILTLKNTRTAANHTLLLDDFTIAESSKAWAFTHWTGDADSGIQNNYAYTHAHSFNTHSSPIINNVQFTGLPEYNNPPNTTITGLGRRHSGISNLEYPSGSADIAETFRYDTNANGELAITLNNLTPSTRYVFSLYGMGWGNPGERASTFTSNIPGSDALTVDLNQFGDAEGLIVTYTYTTDSVGSPVTISYLPTNKNLTGNVGNTFHTSGFSNRTADPVQGAPIITGDPHSNTVAFGDDYTFKVVAAGSNLTYQWRKGAADIDGATSDTLVLSAITLDDAGDYSVNVSNSEGSTISATATLSVKNRVAGLSGTGLARGGLPLSGGYTDPHFVLVANPDDPGKGVTPVYVIAGRPGAWLPNSQTHQWVGPAKDVFGAAGIDTSDAGEEPGVYVYQAQMDLTNFDLSSVVIKGRWATDNAGLALRVNGVDTGLHHNVANTFAVWSEFVIDSSIATFVPGINTIEFVVKNDENNPVPPGGGWTGLLVSDLDAFGDLPPGTAPHITIAPSDIVISPVGYETRFYVGATGSGPLSYQWYFNDAPISGATSPVYAIEGYNASHEGTYHVVVSNSAGTVTTDPFTFTIANLPPRPGDIRHQLNAGDTYAFTVGVITAAAFEPDGDLFRVSAADATSALGGSITFEEDVQIIYTPPAGVIDGDDTFTYTLTDSQNNSSTGTIHITIGAGGGGEPTDPDLGTPGFTFTTGSPAVLTFSAPSAGAYIFQRSLDLAAWENLETRTASGAGSLEFTDTQPPSGRAFYRVIKQ